MNCFQKLLSSWHDTTGSLAGNRINMLWIAFKNYYLRDTTQLEVKKPLYLTRCELLSKIIIFVTRHNHLKENPDCFLVVNCFQKLLSSWHDTTETGIWVYALLLWIAFKNYYLRDTTQPIEKKGQDAYRCELLSKIIIFVTRHNHLRGISHGFIVVNCFQKLLSSWHDTTSLSWTTSRYWLWIAFKNYYLRDTTQHTDIIIIP